jgi:hypothetical protein
MMLRQLALASFILLSPSMLSAQPANFQIEEATIEDIQATILRGELTLTRVVQLYLNRIKAYNGTCVNQPDGVLGLGPLTPIKNAHQLNALLTLNLRPDRREKLGFDPRKARSLTDPVDDDPAMPDALEVAVQQDAYFASTGRLIGPLHGVVFAIKDQYDTLICARLRAWMPPMRTIVRLATQPSSSACGTRVQSSSLRRTWEKWERRTRAARSAVPSAILTIRNAVRAPRAAAPGHRLAET